MEDNIRVEIGLKDVRRRISRLNISQDWIKGDILEHFKVANLVNATDAIFVKESKEISAEEVVIVQLMITFLGKKINEIEPIKDIADMETSMD